MEQTQATVPDQEEGGRAVVSLTASQPRGLTWHPRVLRPGSCTPPQGTPRRR